MKQLYEEYWTREVPPPVADPLTPVRRRLLWSLVERDGPTVGRRLLDCGSGDGGLVAEAAARGLDAVGLEISERAIERAREQHPEGRFLQHAVDYRPWPVDPGSFDYVVSFEVIEHLLDPTALVRGAFDALRPGGRLALSTPYHGLVKNLAITLLAFDKHFDVRGDHVRFFSDRALRSVVEEAGFTVERVDHLGRFVGVWEGTFLWARR